MAAVIAPCGETASVTQAATLAPARVTLGRMSSTLVMFDSANPDTLPPWDGEFALAGYVDGYADYLTIRARYPKARVMSITGHGGVAECADIETGLMSDSDAPGWYRKAVARGVKRPALYRQASSAAGLITVMESAGIPRRSWRLWSAHYEAAPHICGPAACPYPQADGTQWTSAAVIGGQPRNLDQSVLTPGFFDLAILPKKGEKDVYSGIITLERAVGVPVVPGTVKTVTVYADFTSPAMPLRVRVAAHSASRGYQHITEIVLNDSKPHAVALAEPDIDAVSLTRTDKDAGRTVGYIIY